MSNFSQIIFNSIRFIFTSSFLLFILYVIIFSSTTIDGSAYSFFNQNKIRYYYLFFLLIFLVDFYLGFTFIKKNKKLFFSAAKYWIMIVLCYIFGIYFLNKMSLEIPVWGDELYQFAKSMISPLDAASLQHQVPLSYFQSNLSYLSFGYSRLSIRFFTYFSYISFLILVFFYVYNSTNKSKLFSVLAVLFCFVSERLIYHSMDARPQALGLVYFILFLNYLGQFRVRSNISAYLSFYILSFIFLMSVGFQPLFLSFAVLLCFPLLMEKEKRIRRYLKLVFTYILSILSWLPLQLYIKSSSPRRFVDESLMMKFNRNLTQFSVPDFKKLFLTNYSLVNFIIGFCVLLSVAYYVRCKKKVVNFKLPMFFLCSFFIFLFISFNFYKNNIDWNYKYRYTSVALPLFYLFIACSLSQLLLVINLKKISGKLLILSVVFFLVMNLRIGSYATRSVSWYSYDSYILFEKIKKHIVPQSTIFCLAGKWDVVHRHCSGLIMTNKVLDNEYKYFNKPIMPYSILPDFSGRWVDSIKKINGKSFAFILMSKPEILELLDVSFKGSYEIYKGEKYVIILVKDNDVARLQTKSFYLMYEIKNLFQENGIKYFKSLNEALLRYESELKK